MVRWVEIIFFLFFCVHRRWPGKNVINVFLSYPAKVHKKHAGDVAHVI